MECYQVISEKYAGKGLHKGMVGILTTRVDSIVDCEYTFSFPGASTLEKSTELRICVLRNTISEGIFKTDLKEVELEDTDRDKAYDKMCIVNSTIANAYSCEEKIRYPQRRGYEIVPVRVPGLPRYEDFDCRCAAPSQEEIFKMFGLPPWSGPNKVNKTLNIKKIIYNDPATVVIWKDGSKTIVKTAEGQDFSEYFGLLAALGKRIYGTNSAINREIKEKAEYGDSKNKPSKPTKDAQIEMLRNEMANLQTKQAKAVEKLSELINDKANKMTLKLRAALNKALGSIK